MLILNNYVERIQLMITKTIVVSGAIMIFAPLGFAPTTGTEPPSFGVLNCGECRERRAPDVPAFNEIERGVLEGLLFVPTKPFGKNPNFR